MGLNQAGHLAPQGQRVYIAHELPQEVDRIWNLFIADGGPYRVVRIGSNIATVREAFLAQSGPEADILLISDTMGDPQNYAGLQVVRDIAQQRPQVTTLVLTQNPDPMAHKTILKYGASDVIVQPLRDLAELKGVLANIAARDQQRVQAVQTADRPQGIVVAPEAAAPVVRQTMITVYSPRGGTGKSSLAANIALAIQQNPTMHLRTVLVDFDVNWGSVSSMLGIRPTLTIKDLIHNIDSMDRQLVDRCLMKHDTGLRVLLAPDNPGDEDLVTEDVARKILAMLREMFDVIVVDTGQVLRDSTILAIEQADKVLVVSRPDVPAIKHLKKFHEVIEALEMKNDGKVMLVLNQVGRVGEDGISVTQLTELLPFPLVAKIPWVPNFQLFINNGTPLVLEPSDHPYKHLVQQIVHNILPIYGPVLNGRRRLVPGGRNAPKKRPGPGAQPPSTALRPVGPLPPMPKPARPPGLLGRLFRR